MSSRWESVVDIARQIDASCAKGNDPDPDVVTRLARAVLEFQQHLVDIGKGLQSPAPKPPAPPSTKEDA